MILSDLQRLNDNVRLHGVRIWKEALVVHSKVALIKRTLTESMKFMSQ